MPYKPEKQVRSELLFPLRALHVFRELLMNQSMEFLSQDMTIQAHYVHKTDLTGHLSEKDIQASRIWLLKLQYDALR